MMRVYPQKDAPPQVNHGGAEVMPETNQLKGELPTDLDNASRRGIHNLARRRTTDGVADRGSTA